MGNLKLLRTHLIAPLSNPVVCSRLCTCIALTYLQKQSKTMLRDHITVSYPFCFIKEIDKYIFCLFTVVVGMVT